MRHHSHPSKPDDEPVPDPIRPAGNLLPPSTRKKAIGVRPWLLLDSTGEAEVIEVGKHAIMRRTGLPARDLRILDPLLSYPSTVLGRERAIVINLEHIKAIITSEEVLLLNSRDPSVVPFVEELQKRLVCHYQATKAQETNGDYSNWTEEQQTTAVSPNNLPEGFSNSQGQDEEDKADGKQVLEKGDGSRVLPFEFIALEACLEAACSCLEMEAKTLELEAHPALDKLTSKISTLNLERVRQIKSRLVAITGRVQKVRDELEHLLDDDDDMAEMYLTEKMIQQHLENSSTSSSIERGEMADEDLQADLDDGIPANAPLEALGVSTGYDGDMYNAESTQDHLFSAHHVLMTASHGTRTSTTRSAISKQLDVEELEMLLEAYFVQIDGTLNKLSTLREYVDDTEDYINIMLDDKQNHLLQMGVMLTTATLVVSSFVVVVGIFGMNIRIDMFKETVETGMPKFLWTVGGGATGSIFLYIIAIAWCKHKRLLE